jgi:ABC-type transport system involved in cytochrome bd biosynthesis fused ATPase/permease subunit
MLKFLRGTFPATFAVMLCALNILIDGNALLATLILGIYLLIIALFLVIIFVMQQKYNKNRISKRARNASMAHGSFLLGRRLGKF